MINGITFGVHDIPDGSFQVTLDALKAELAKTSKIGAELALDGMQDFSIDRIVSSTSDSASTQKKINRLLEEETGKHIVENKCSTCLGVNLRLAQVKTAAGIGVTNDSDADLESDGEVDVEDGCSPGSNDSSDYSEKDFSDSENSSDGSENDSENDSVVGLDKNLNRDIDLFVHELAKLFGHLRTPEYCHGASTFRIFLSHKARQCTGVEKEYYECAQKIVLERQVGSRYYVTSCNAGRLYFLREAMVSFLKEQKLIKALNCLESSCLQKLQDPLLLANLRLQGLMFDKVYADLMTLVKSTDLSKSALDMNIHYEELLEFFDILITSPAALFDSETLVFKSELLLYSESSKLNHRLTKKYIPVQRELQRHQENDGSFLLPMVIAAGKAMRSKIQTYMEDHLPGG